MSLCFSCEFGKGSKKCNKCKRNSKLKDCYKPKTIIANYYSTFNSRRFYIDDKRVLYAKGNCNLANYGFYCSKIKAEEKLNKVNTVPKQLVMDILFKE